MCVLFNCILLLMLSETWSLCARVCVSMCLSVVSNVSSTCVLREKSIFIMVSILWQCTSETLMFTACRSLWMCIHYWGGEIVHRQRRRQEGKHLLERIYVVKSERKKIIGIIICKSTKIKEPKSIFRINKEHTHTKHQFPFHILTKQVKKKKRNEKQSS